MPHDLLPGLWLVIVRIAYRCWQYPTVVRIDTAIQYYPTMVNAAHLVNILVPHLISSNSTCDHVENQCNVTSSLTQYLATLVALVGLSTGLMFITPTLKHDNTQKYRLLIKVINWLTNVTVIQQWNYQWDGTLLQNYFEVYKQSHVAQVMSALYHKIETDRNHYTLCITIIACDCERSGSGGNFRSPLTSFSVTPVHRPLTRPPALLPLQRIFFMSRSCSFNFRTRSAHVPQ